MSRLRIRSALAYAAALLVAVAPAAAQSGREIGRFTSPSSGTQLRMLLDASNLAGSEVEVGEMTFPARLDSGEHVHGTVEIFYVLSGELEHVVNGRSYLLKPGVIGWVRPPDKVVHRVPSDTPVRALVIWAPGGEAGKITARWPREPDPKPEGKK